MGMRCAEARVQVEHLNTLGFSSCAAITTTAPGKRTRYMAIRRGTQHIVCSAPDWDSARGREDVEWWAQCGQWLGPLCPSPLAAYASGELFGWSIDRRD